MTTGRLQEPVVYLVSYHDDNWDNGPQMICLPRGFMPSPSIQALRWVVDGYVKPGSWEIHGPFDSIEACAKSMNLPGIVGNFKGFAGLQPPVRKIVPAKDRGDKS